MDFSFWKLYRLLFSSEHERNGAGYLTEIGDAGVGPLNLIGNTENGRNLNKRWWHHLTVKHGLTKVHSGLCPHDAARPWLLLQPRPGQRSWQGRHRDHFWSPLTTRELDTQTEGSLAPWWFHNAHGTVVRSTLLHPSQRFSTYGEWIPAAQPTTRAPCFEASSCLEFPEFSVWKPGSMSDR